MSFDDLKEIEKPLETTTPPIEIQTNDDDGKSSG